MVSVVFRVVGVCGDYGLNERVNTWGQRDVVLLERIEGAVGACEHSIESIHDIVVDCMHNTHTHVCSGCVIWVLRNLTEEAKRVVGGALYTQTQIHTMVMLGVVQDSGTKRTQWKSKRTWLM